MATHTFTLILDARPDRVDGPLADALFEAGCDDALLAASEGAVHLDFDRDAASFAEAILSAIREVESTGVRVVRVEPNDLVTLTEIARRTGRSVESVRLLAEGKRGAGDFPVAVRGTREGPRLWKWVEIAVWFAEHVADALARHRPRPGSEARRSALEEELERSRLEVENARVISALNGAFAIRANAPPGTRLIDAVNAFLHGDMGDGGLSGP